MTPALNSALAITDRLGVRLWLEDGDRLRFRCGPAGFPDSVRAVLRDQKPELVDLLKVHPRPDPPSVRFIATNLDWVHSSGLSSTHLTGVRLHGRPYYRLTPAVYFHLEAKAVALFDQLDEATTLDLCNQMAKQLEWVEAYYRPDQLERAKLQPGPLPTIAADAWFAPADGE